MNPIVALSYFHRKIGPTVFYTYPKNSLNREISSMLATIMDQPPNESFFINAFEHFTCLNYYFEIQSNFARGNYEMLMVSGIFEHQLSHETEQKVASLLKEYSKNLQSDREVYTAFHKDNISQFEDNMKELVLNNFSLVKLWVKELYWAVFERTRKKTEDEKISELLSKNHIYCTLQELAKGPFTLEELEDWFNTRFPDENFNSLLNSLLYEQFVSVNQIGRVEKYIILLKEVSIERVPPGSVIEYFDEQPELIDLLLQKVQKYFNKYEMKTQKELEEDGNLLFHIIADSKMYNLISKLKEGLIQRDMLPKLLSQKTLDNLIETIEFLKEKDVIEELIYNEERYVVLKSMIQITTAFPEYLRKAYLDRKNFDEIN